MATRYDKPQASELYLATNEDYNEVTDSMLTTPPVYPQELINRP